MKKVPLRFPFILAVIAAIYGALFFPSIRLIAFAPFLAIVYNRSTFIRSLWLATVCGLILDLLCSQLRFGLHALNYCLTTILIYKQKRHFFEDKPLALSLFTALISAISTLVQLVLLYTFDKQLPLTWKLFGSDLLIMPCVDAVYAYLWFSCPIHLYETVQRVGLRNILQKITSFFRPEKESE